MADKLPSGKWRARWYDDTKTRRTATFATQAAAEAAERRGEVARDNIRAGLAPATPTRVTVGDIYRDWLDKRPVARRKDDESRLRIHVLPYFELTELRTIDRRALEGFIRHLEAKKTARNGQSVAAAKRLAPNTIKNCLILVCKLLGDHGFRVTVKYKVPTSGYAWIAEARDVARYLDACTPEWFRMASALAVYAGLRAGEVFGLRRDAIDFERDLIRVDRSYDGPTKSKHMRWVPLSPALAPELKSWLLKHPGDLVVTRENGKTPRTSTLAKYARRACRRADVTSVNFHQLRHTAASHLAQRVPLPVMGAILGHADPKTTARYAHLDTESIARSERVQLDFRAPKRAKVIELPSRQKRAR